MSIFVLSVTVMLFSVIDFMMFVVNSELVPKMQAASIAR